MNTKAKQTMIATIEGAIALAKKVVSAAKAAAAKSEKWDPLDISSVSLEETPEEKDSRALSGLLGKLKYYWVYGDQEVRFLIAANFKVVEPITISRNGNVKTRALYITLKEAI